MEENYVKNMLTAICSVQFHLTEGQKVEAIYPVNALNKAEIAAVAMSSLPDSMSYELSTRNSIRDTSFSFRIPRLPADTSTTISSPKHQAAVISTEYLHGFVFCRQRQDEKLPRGGEQRAIVILSPLPLKNLLTPLSQYAGPLCLAQGASGGALRAVYEEVATWTRLIECSWGGAVELPLGHAVLRVDLPDLSSIPLDSAHAVAQLTGVNSAADALAEELDLDTGCPLSLLPRASGQQGPATGLFSDTDIFTPFAAHIKHLWTLWEILLLGDPLIIASPTPSACSDAVLALASLLAPLPYSADYRPYFTIHDPAFGPFASGAMPNSFNASTLSLNGDNTNKTCATTTTPTVVSLPSLVGVTNPFIIKTLSSWPNILSTGYTSLTTGGGEDNNTNSGSTKSSGSHQNSGRPQSSNGGVGSISSSASNGGGVLGSILRRPSLPEIIKKRIIGSSHSTALSLLGNDPPDSAWLSHRNLLSPDMEIFNSLVMPETKDGVARRGRLAQMNSTILRRHFEELGRAVVFPLLPFITPTPPPSATNSLWSASGAAFASSPPPLPELDTAVFIKNIASGAVNIPEILAKRCGNGNKRTLAEFYKRLLTESTAMANWLRARRAAASAFQAATWRHAWRQAGGAFLLPGIIENTEDVGGMEEFLSAEAEMKRAAGKNSAGGDGTSNDDDVSILLEKLRLKFNALPSDLQDSLLMNPERKALLGM
jgi:hypothetical protein